jgi:DNA invertase Pin-like site-specific DNA recombinase
MKSIQEIAFKKLDIDPDMFSKLKKGKTIFYRRVSAIDQNLDRQEIPDIKFDKIFEEKESGKSRDRLKLKEMLDYIRDDDVIYVYSVDRLARSVRDLENIVQEIKDKQATIIFFKENLKFSSSDDDMYAKFTFTMLGAFAEFERSINRSRQLEGIEKAKKKGTWHGKLSDDDKVSIIEKYRSGVNITRIAKDYNVSRPAIYNVLSQEKVR